MSGIQDASSRMTGMRPTPDDCVSVSRSPVSRHRKPIVGCNHEVAGSGAAAVLSGSGRVAVDLESAGRTKLFGGVHRGVMSINIKVSNIKVSGLFSFINIKVSGLFSLKGVRLIFLMCCKK